MEHELRFLLLLLYLLRQQQYGTVLWQCSSVLCNQEWNVALRDRLFSEAGFKRYKGKREYWVIG